MMTQIHRRVGSYPTNRSTHNDDPGRDMMSPLSVRSHRHPLKCAYVELSSQRTVTLDRK